MDIKKFNNLLAEAVAFHGHLCAGQIIGVRMAMLGLAELGLSDPRGEDRKKLIVYVEIDRCATDAIMTVTGCRVGKRNMKVFDFGKMAATFLNLETGKAVRITSHQEARVRAAAHYPGLSDLEAQKLAYREMDDRELFIVEEVYISPPPEDLPGRSLAKCTCAVCGENILDKREVRIGQLTLCRPCSAGRTYYSRVQATSAVAGNGGRR